MPQAAFVLALVIGALSVHTQTSLKRHGRYRSTHLVPIGHMLLGTLCAGIEGAAILAVILLMTPFSLGFVLAVSLSWAAIMSVAYTGLPTWGPGI